MNEPLIGWKPFADSPKVASARIRCYRPLALLRKGGFPIEQFREENQNRYRVVILQKLYDPEHVALARRLRRQGTRVVFDLCDNHLYNPTCDPKYAQQGQWLREMMDIADVVTVPTPTLADFLPRPATVVRDGIEPYHPRLPWERIGASRQWGRRRVELVWFGIWGNSRAPFGMKDLTIAADAIRSLAKTHPVRLTVISNSYDAFMEHVAPLPFLTRYRKWDSNENLCRLLPRHDICLIPVNCNPFTLPKSANRLALALYLGVPVVATAIPSYEEFRPFAFLDDWNGGLHRLAQDAAFRHERVSAGRRYVLGTHMMEHAAEEWRQLLKTLL